MDSAILASSELEALQKKSTLQSLESEYIKSLRDEDLIAKDEDVRRLRLQILLVKEEKDDFEERLAEEEDQIYNLERERVELLAQLDQADIDARQHQADLRATERELEMVKTELTSLNNLLKDSNKVLNEKLELARELGTLKPELDYLRGQALGQQEILSHKLKLERKLSTLDAELEAANATIERQEAAKEAAPRRIAELEKQLETLKTELSEERAERAVMARNSSHESTANRQAAEASAEKKHAEHEKELKELKKELAREKKGREEAELKAAESATSKVEATNGSPAKKTTGLEKQLKDLKKELFREKKAREATELMAANIESSKKETAGQISFKKDADFAKQLANLKAELAREKQEQERVQIGVERDAKEWETKRLVLESKAEAMKAKLCATKEELKAVQASLAQTIAQASKGATMAEDQDASNKSRKRAAVSISDNTIGTPDGIVARGKRGGAKRGKPDQMSLGEKSMFSITPYLNKTTILPIDTPKEATTSDVQSETEPPIITDTNLETCAPVIDKPIHNLIELSPSISRAKPDIKGKKPSVQKTNAAVPKKAVGGKKAPMSVSLEQVQEETKEDQGATVERQAAASEKKLAKIPNLGAEEMEPKKKKRKILGASKTLFDEEDAEATRHPAKVILPPGQPLAKFGPKKCLRLAPGGQFGAFSPLKKDKRGVQASFLG